MPDIPNEDVPKPVRDLFNKGNSAFERGNLDYAIDLYSSVVEQAPRFVEARKKLRTAEIQKFRKKKGGNLKHMFSSAKDMPAYLSAMAKVKSGKAAEALESAEKMLRDDPLNARFVKLFAQTAIAAGMPEVAVFTLEQAREAYPNDITILNWLGSIYLKLSRTRSARECFEKICEIAPNDPDANKALKDAMALDSMADGWSAAAEDGGSYRDLIKDQKEAVLLEQESKAVKGEKDVAALIEDTLEKIKEEPENINYYRHLAQLYVQRKSFDRALSTIGKAREMSPGDPELDATVSEIKAKQFDQQIEQLRAAGDIKAAEGKDLEKRQFLFDDLQERVRRYPNDLKLRYELGVMLYENEFINEAIQQFQLSQRSPKHRIKSLYYIGMCFRHKRQLDLAVEQFEAAASEISMMDNTKKDIIYQLAGVYEEMGDTKNASERYKQIYQVDIGYRDVAEKVEQVYS